MFTGREYGVEIRCGDRRHWRLTRKQVRWTSEINWTEMGTIARLLIDKGFGFIRTENGAEYFLSPKFGAVGGLRAVALQRRWRHLQRAVARDHGGPLSLRPADGR